MWGGGQVCVCKILNLATQNTIFVLCFFINVVVVAVVYICVLLLVCLSVCLSTSTIVTMVANRQRVGQSLMFYTYLVAVITIAVVVVVIVVWLFSACVHFLSSSSIEC